MISIKQSADMTGKVFDELCQYNDQFEPKVNYKPITFIAEEDGKFIGGLEGYIAWDHFEIANMAALKKKCGIGRHLIEHLERFCKQNKITSISCWTLDFQAPDFYKKCGFETVAVVPEYAGKHACHHFIKRL